MPRRSMQTAIPYGTPPKRWRSNGTPSLQGGGCLPFPERHRPTNIQMITEKNNMHDFDTSMFFRWIFKSAFAILIVSNTWNIVMGVFDATQSVVNQSSGVIIGETSIHFDRLIPGLEFQLESMTINQIKIQRSLTTSNVAVFVPFVTQELFQSGAAMYYGINAKSHNMIMLDRKQARCPNGLKLGTPGSGKSMSCKSEIVSVFLTTADDIFISDPEAEYYPLVKRLHGQVIKLSPTSKDYVNPLDINLNYSEDDSPLALSDTAILTMAHYFQQK